MFKIIAISITLLAGSNLCFSADVSSRRESITILTANNAQISSEQEKQIAQYLSSRVSDYLEELQAIPSSDYSDNSESTLENGITTKDMVEGLIASNKSMLLYLEWILNNDQESTDLQWAVITELLAIDIPYMRDANRLEMLDSDWVSESMFLLPAIFSKFIIERIEAA